jgi:hypothetical protein
MRTWPLKALGVERSRPQIHSSTGDARAIALICAAGSSFKTTRSERAWLVVVEGEVEVTTAGGNRSRAVRDCWSSSFRLSATRSVPFRRLSCCCCLPHGPDPAIRDR